MKLINHLISEKNQIFSELKVNKLAQRLTKTRLTTFGSAICISLCLLTFWETAIAQEQNLSLSNSRLTKNEALLIKLQKNQLSIEAKQVSWQTLLTTLEEKTHIPIKFDKPKEANVTVSIPAMPVDQALQRLFSRHFDYVLLFTEAKTIHLATPKAIWLLNNVTNTTNAGNSGLTNNQAAAKFAPETGMKTLSIAGKSGHKTAQELLDKANNDANIEKKIQALANLSGSGQANKMTETLALENALEDKDARVREYAVQALASQNNPEITGYLRQALGDPDAGVRMRAVESITPKSEGLALLEEALTNPDKLVQAMAKARLSQVEQ